MNHEGFFSYNDIYIEKMFMFLFPDERFPDTYALYDARPAIKSFFLKERGFTLYVKSISDAKSEKDDFPSDILVGSDIKSLLKIRGAKERMTLYLNSQSKCLAMVKQNRDDETVSLFLACSNRNYLDKLSAIVKEKFAIEQDSNSINFGLLYDNGYGVEVNKYPLSDKYIHNLDIGLHYGDDFLKVDELIYNKLKSNERSLFLFHGHHGTGKTSLIKNLAYRIKSKNFIFIPPQYIDSLVSPKLIPVLLDHKNSVLVLEDAEKAIISRERQEGNESLVSALLNLSDGILGSILNISIIVTFNTKKEKIDEALCRKGRLSYEHEFKPLKISEAQRLIDKLGKEHKADEPMTLADIYGIGASTGHNCEVREEIGFKVR